MARRFGAVQRVGVDSRVSSLVRSEYQFVQCMERNTHEQSIVAKSDRGRGISRVSLINETRIKGSPSTGVSGTLNGFSNQHTVLATVVVKVTRMLRSAAYEAPANQLFFEHQFNSSNATWLILPVVVCLSRRLSHACKVQAPICEGETANGSLNQS